MIKQKVFQRLKMPNENKVTVLKDPQIYVTKKMRKLFDQIKEDIPQFKTMVNKEFFMLILMLGYHNSSRIPINPKDLHENGFFREIQFTNQERAIFYAIAIEAEKNIEVIKDIRQIIKITQEYAQGGYDYINKIVFNSHGSLENKLSELLLPYIEKQRD